MNQAIKPIHVCEKFFQSGKLQPICLNYPSFSIDNNSFKFFALDTVEEKIRQTEFLPGSKIENLINEQNPQYNNEARDIAKKTINTALSTLTQSKFSELSSNDQFITLSSTSEQLAHFHDKSKLAATLLMVKHGLPNSGNYEHVMDALDTHFNKDLLSEIKEMIKKPQLDTVNHIFQIDPKMATENFPKQTKQLIDLQKPIYFQNHKLA